MDMGVGTTELAMDSLHDANLVQGIKQSNGMSTGIEKNAKLTNGPSLQRKMPSVASPD